MGRFGSQDLPRSPTEAIERTGPHENEGEPANVAGNNPPTAENGGALCVK